MLRESDIRAHLNSLTKPPGSLGSLEDLAARLCLIQGTLKPETTPRALVLFAGDHGVTRQGVTMWPSSVTTLMIANILAGGAASSVLAAQTRTELRVVDVGSFAPAETDALLKSEYYRNARIAPGTADLAAEPAMDTNQLDAAIAIGREEAARAVARGARILATGEMGIGNTTPAACLAALLTDAPADAVTGRGAGADDATLARKRAVVEAAVARARPALAAQPRQAIAAVAGFEIAAMAGFYMGAKEAGVPTVLDGFIATAAALVAEHLAPGTASILIAAHASAEIGHASMLAHLGLSPLLSFQMHLGEGSGALLAIPLLDAAAAIVRDMATFASAGIARG